MKAAFTFALCLVALFAFTALGLADKKPAPEPAEKEVTLKGKVTCPKCDLGDAKACATVIVVKEGKETKVYWFDAAADKKHHSEICKAGKNATVKGVVSEKDGKLHIKVSDCKFD